MGQSAYDKAVQDFYNQGIIDGYTTLEDFVSAKYGTTPGDLYNKPDGPVDSSGNIFNTDYGNPDYQDPNFLPNVNKPPVIPIGGDPSFPQIDTGSSYDQSGVIGGGGTLTGGQDAPPDWTPEHPFIDRPANNGGLFGSGIDIGIPGIFTIGDIVGLTGLGDMADSGGFGGGGGIFGSGSAGSPAPTAPPPAAVTPPDNSQPIGGPLTEDTSVTQIPVASPGPATQTPPPSTAVPTGLAILGAGIIGSQLGSGEAGQGQSQPPATVPPVAPPSNAAPDQPVQSVTVPPPIFGTPITRESPLTPPEAPTTPTTIPPIVPPGAGGVGVDEGAQPVTIPPPVGVGPGGGPVEAPTTPTTVPPVIPPPTTPTVTPPVTTVIPSVIPNTPTPTMPTLPPDRNYFNEGNQTTQDFNRLGPGIFGNYAQYSGQYGTADQNNFASLLQQLGINNSTLTNFANQQTASGNTALRTGNVADASALGGQALSTLQQLNPNQYAALAQAQSGAGGSLTPSAIQQLLQQQALEGLQSGAQLSDQERNQAQQAAREAWGARGLINSQGAVGDEILNTYNLGQQRLQQRQGLAQSVDTNAFNQRQQGLNSVYQNAALQSQYAFNPLTAISGANTTNQGSNQALFGQGSGFSSGQLGNQNVNQLVNPFSPYAQDVYNSNYNAGNARYISAGNNAAAAAGANSAASGELANSFLRLAGQIYGSSCWIAREIYGEDDSRWMKFRDWLFTLASDELVSLYLRCGERLAECIRANPWLKPEIRAFMDSKISTQGV